MHTQIPFYNAIFWKTFSRLSVDCINLHKKNETAGAEFKTSMVILLKTLFWNKKKKKENKA